jgi:hypothetical protein
MITPWQQKVPRNKIPTGNTHQYRRITAIGVTGKSTAAEGTVGNQANYTADIKTVSLGIISSGLHDVTWEAEQAAGTFDNLRSRTVTNALLVGRRHESAHIFGGNVTAIGATSTPTVVDDATHTDSDFGSATYYAYIKPLTAMAMQKAVLAGLLLKPTGALGYCYPAGYTSSAPALSCDQTDGWGVESSVGSGAITATHGCTITWTPKDGAAGYGIFGSVSTGITNCKLLGVTGQCKITLGKVGSASSSAGVSGDNSADANDFNGLLPLLYAAGSGAYIKSVSSSLTAASGQGIPEIDEMLESCFLNSPGIDSGYLACGITDRHAITYALGTGASSSIARILLPQGPDGAIAAGGLVSQYIHPVTGKPVPIVTDPWMAGGTICWIPESIPYPMADVPAPMALWLSYDWTAFEYAMTAPVRKFENRMRGGLAVYLPPAFGILRDVRRP